MHETIYYDYVDSPPGRLLVCGDGKSVTGLYFPRHKGGLEPDASFRRESALFAAVREQLGEYFAGTRREFDVPVRLAGTAFQRRVWAELTRIPFGTTIAYAELARRVGNPAACRAVGAANGKNPVSIIVPCHRVIGADGKLTGYGGGVEMKRWLLDWERGEPKEPAVASPRSLFDAARGSARNPPVDFGAEPISAVRETRSA